MESGKKENQVRISLDFSGDREFGKYMEDIGAVQVDLALETPEPEDITRAEFTFEASIQTVSYTHLLKALDPFSHGLPVLVRPQAHMVGCLLYTSIQMPSLTSPRRPFSGTFRCV